MESFYTELALYGSKNECAKTNNVFFPISEVCDGTVSLMFYYYLCIYFPLLFDFFVVVEFFWVGIFLIKKNMKVSTKSY
jgi:hypothetical protein